MSSTKKQSGWVKRVASSGRLLIMPILGNGSGPLIAVTFLVMMLCGWYFGWHKWGRAITAGPKYRLTAKSLEITGQPSWIAADIRAEVMRDGSLGELSVLDPDLTKRIARAFELHTWVARVRRVAKRPGKTAPRILVDLVYREPIVMVKTLDGFWPIDTEGVLLPPNDFSPSQTRAYLRVWGGRRQPLGPVGTPFGDASIAGAARVASALRDVWRKLGLEWILVQRAAPQISDRPAPPTFVLLPAGTSSAVVQRRASQRAAQSLIESGRLVEVRWGHAPGREVAGEASAAEKIGRLVQLVQQRGPLDAQTKSLVIDLRPRPGLTVTARRSTEAPGPLR